MNEIFPPINAVSLETARPGSIVRIPRSGGPILALKADKSPNDTGHSFVVLNSKVANRPSVYFAKNWRNENSCMAYKENLQFELSVHDADLNIGGSELWDVPGVIISTGDQFFIRAFAFEPFSGDVHHVNIQTGALFAGQLPSDICTFPSWQIWLRDSKERSFCIFKFKIGERAP